MLAVWRTRPAYAELILFMRGVQLALAICEEEKTIMLNLISQIKARLEKINDGSFVIENLETEKLVNPAMSAPMNSVAWCFKGRTMAVGSHRCIKLLLPFLSKLLITGAGSERRQTSSDACRFL